VDCQLNNLTESHTTFGQAPADSNGLPPKASAFANRHDAGLRLAIELAAYRASAPVVLGLARGGVAVARVVADALGAPFGVFVALKLRVPGQPEVAAGAVAPGVRFVCDDVVRELEISTSYLTIAAEELERELVQRAALFCTSANPALHERHVILIDDGIASGATAAAAVRSVRLAGAKHVVVSAPVASTAGLKAVRIADEVIVPFVPKLFRAVSDAYQDFTQLSDNDVCALLALTTRGRGRA
jgi:predicted phosphoribosyltransferase